MSRTNGSRVWHKTWPLRDSIPARSGGHGEVYRARDSRLGRDVAIEVLPESMATDSERLRRFETVPGGWSAVVLPLLPWLCYSFPPHGDTPSESCAKTESRIALLPELR
jgi:serine/threonine protein kinase